MNFGQLETHPDYRIESSYVLSPTTAERVEIFRQQVRANNLPVLTVREALDDREFPTIIALMSRGLTTAEPEEVVVDLSFLEIRQHFEAAQQRLEWAERQKFALLKHFKALLMESQPHLDANRIAQLEGFIGQMDAGPLAPVPGINQQNPPTWGPAPPHDSSPLCGSP
ncbi:unnamed protein product, partial [Mesorhabditis spiculigera]